jgi:hypothetical protein
VALRPALGLHWAGDTKHWGDSLGPSLGDTLGTSLGDALRTLGLALGPSLANTGSTTRRARYTSGKKAQAAAPQ